MSERDNDFDFDLESILAEFGSHSGSDKAAPDAENAKNAAHSGAAPDKRGSAGAEEYYVDVDVSRLENYINARRVAKTNDAPDSEDTARRAAQSAGKAQSAAAAQGAGKAQNPANAQRAEKTSAAENEKFSPSFKPSGREYRPPEAWAVRGASGARAKKTPDFDPDKFLTDSEKRKAEALRKKAETKQKKLDAQKSAMRQKDREAIKAQERSRELREKTQSPAKNVLAFVFGVLAVFALCWLSMNVRTGADTSTGMSMQSNLNLTSKLDVFVNNAASDALGDLAYIKKIYTIPETDTVAPKPDESAFGTTTDPAVIESVIASAAELLDGQETVWQPDLPFYPNTEMYYYRDATILVIVWKEIVQERCATLAEVKIADGSQFRRKLAEDTYGSSVYLNASTLAAAANAVVASNADYYAYRQTGLTVYQRQLFRNSGDKLDTCFVTASGDMLFTRAGELVGDEAVQQYIEDNDVLFSLSFGPVLVENGEAQYCESYPIGEINTEYSRAGIGMTDELHYLLMTVNHTDGRHRATVNQFAELMQSKGVTKAYNLDGGQTSEITILGKAVNYVDFGAERAVSDIIYFATAIPDKEVGE